MRPFFEIGVPSGVSAHTPQGPADRPDGLIKKVLSELLQLQQSGLSR
jgi:hypothetical protein